MAPAAAGADGGVARIARQGPRLLVRARTLPRRRASRAGECGAAARLTAHAVMDPITARRGRFHRCDYGGRGDHHRARDFAPSIAPPGATIRYIATLERGGSSAPPAANEPRLFVGSLRRSGLS